MDNLDENIGKIPKKLELTGAMIIILILFSLYGLFFIIKYSVDIQCNNVALETDGKVMLYVDRKYYPKLNALNTGDEIKIYYNKNKPDEKLFSGEIIDLQSSNNDDIEILVKIDNMDFNYSSRELTVTAINNLISCIKSRYE